MADIGSLVANLMVNSSQFNRDINKAARHTKSFSAKTNQYLSKAEKKWKSLSKTIFSLKGAFGAVLGVYGIKKLSSSFLDAATTSENFRVRLEVLLGSVDEGNRLFKQMADYAGKVPFQYEKVMASATQLSGVMKGGVDEITQWMPLIGDLAAAAGVDIEKATEQVVRMYSAGAASADLFREKGILAMMGFKAGVSYSAEETRKMMMETWQKADSQFRGATDKMANTWTGMISMISDKWFKLRNMIMDAGAFEELKSILSDIDERFGAWLETNKNIIAQKIPEYIEKIKTGFQKIWDILNYDPDIIKFGIIGLAFWGKKGAVILGGLVHMVNWVKNLSAALALASTGAVSFKEVAAANFKELEAIVKRFDDSVQGAMGNFVRMKIPKETWVKPDGGVGGGGEVIEDAEAAKKAMEEYIKRAKEAAAIEYAAPFDYEQFIEPVKASFETVYEEFTILHQKVATIWSDLWDKTKDYWDKTKNVISDVWGAIEKYGIGPIKMMITMPMQMAIAMKDFVSAIQDFPELVDQVIEAFDYLIDNLPEIVTKFVEGLEKLIPAFIKRLPEIIEILAEAIPDVAAALILGILEGLPDIIVALVNAVPTIIAEFVKRIPEIVAEFAKAIAKMVIPGQGEATVTGIDIIPDIIPIIGKWFHKGGIVGKTTTSSRALPANVFAGAPRLHSGLRPGEIPAIVEEGEEIIPKDRVRRTGTNVNITLHNAGVITTENVDEWLSNTITRLRKNKVGEEFSMLNIATAGVDI